MLTMLDGLANGLDTQNGLQRARRLAWRTDCGQLSVSGASAASVVHAVELAAADSGSPTLASPASLDANCLAMFGDLTMVG